MSDGSVHMSNYDVEKNSILHTYKYRPDGSLESYSNFKDNSEMHISKNGKITKFNLQDKDGNFIKRSLDDEGKLLSERS